MLSASDRHCGRLRQRVDEVHPHRSGFKQQEFGDPRPVYCRADICHIFLAWTDSSGEQQVLESPTLYFKGSPTSLSVHPDSNLGRSAWVLVAGTADGAQGHSVQVYEETCFAIIQGHGCTQQYPTVTTRVTAHGKLYALYHVHRILPDGRDCTNQDEMWPEYCQVTAVVQTHGQPDYSFGDPTWGNPHGELNFATS